MNALEIAAFIVATIGNIGLAYLLVNWPKEKKTTPRRCGFCNAELLKNLVCRNAFCPELRSGRRKITNSAREGYRLGLRLRLQIVDDDGGAA